MIESETFKFPRLCVDAELGEGKNVMLAPNKPIISEPFYGGKMAIPSDFLTDETANGWAICKTCRKRPET